MAGWFVTIRPKPGIFALSPPRVTIHKSFLLPALLLVSVAAAAQVGVTTLGLQVKPVASISYFDPVSTVERDHLVGKVDLQGGFAFGMSVRIGLSKAISLETGLGQISRRYNYTITNDTSGYNETGTIRYVGYELPLTGLVNIRLGERTWMNTALGVSMDFYPSDVESIIDEGSIFIFRRNWAQFGVLGNLGVEYRTDKSGIFYLGATFHRPFNDMALADLTWTYLGPPTVRRYTLRTPLSGSYLTVDLRYYFHEDPERRVKRSKK